MPAVSRLLLSLLPALLVACDSADVDAGERHTAAVGEASNPHPELDLGPMFGSPRIEEHFTGPDLQLAQAAARGDERAVADLVRAGANPNAVSRHGMALVLWPLQQKNLTGVRALLAAGADPNLAPPRPEGGSVGAAISVAARLPDPAFLEVFLDHGGNLQARDGDGTVLLHVAKLANNWPGIQLLVRRGADIDALHQDLPANTLLAYYSGIGAKERALWLLEHGADPSLRNRQGAQPILENLYWRPTDPKRYPEHRELDRRLWRALQRKGHRPPPEPEYWREVRERLQLPQPQFDDLS